MKFLLIARSKNPPPVKLEYQQAMVEAAEVWIERELSSGQLDFVYAFIEGGGVGILEADSTELVMKKLLDYPLYIFFDWKVEALVDFETGLRLTKERVERMLNPV